MQRRKAASLMAQLTNGETGELTGERPWSGPTTASKGAPGLLGVVSLRGRASAFAAHTNCNKPSAIPWASSCFTGGFAICCYCRSDLISRLPHSKFRSLQPPRPITDAKRRGRTSPNFMCQSGHRASADGHASSACTVALDEVAVGGWGPHWVVSEEVLRHLSLIHI